MAVLWVILILASTGLQLAQGLPLNPTPRAYPHEASGSVFEAWSGEAVVPALAVVITAIGVLFGCTWCYRHKDCKPNEGADNQLFTASVTHLHDARRSQPPDAGFSEPVNNNISEDNNNGPISMREMQNIANNNAAVYITSENEERNRISRESVVEFEPLPSDIRVVDPLERCADWFAGEDFPRDQLQYLREIGRGWFGRVVEGEIDDGGSTSTVAVKILNQNASLEDKARFLDEGRLYRDMNHENVLGFVAKLLQEDPWILLFELCSMDLQQYLIVNRPKMAILNESGVPLQLMCDVTSALAYIHSRGYLYGNLWSGNILVRGGDHVRAVIGQYCTSEPPVQCAPPETDRQPHIYNSGSEVWSLGWVVWSVCSWGSAPPAPPAPAPDLPCPYRNHLYQVMQLCWNQNPESRPSAAQVHALINHLHFTHSHANDSAKDDGYSSSDFEERWQKLKPNTIPKIDEHIAIVHAPSTSMVSHFTGSDQEFDNAATIQDSLSVELDTAVSRSSSIMSDRDPLSIQIKSDSLTNLHGSLEDVRNIYLTHNETATLECHQGNIQLEEGREREDRSDSSMDPWIKDIINGSQDDVSYYKDVSDVIKNLDNILNSEKTSSSESSHQASPSRDNLSLECKKDYPMQTSMVKSPGISNFQNILDMGFDSKSGITDRGEDEDGDGDTIGTLSHSFERHSDTISQQTLENLTPETPVKDLKTPSITNLSDIENICIINDDNLKPFENDGHSVNVNNVASNNSVPKLMELCVASIPSVSEINEQVILKQDCQTNKQTSDIITTDSKYSKEKAMDVNVDFINKEIEDKNEITTEMQIINEIEPSVEKEITSELQNTNELETHVKNESTTQMQIKNEIKTNLKHEITTQMQIKNEIEPKDKNEITTDLQNTNELETNFKNLISTEMQIVNEIEPKDKNEITTEWQNTNKIETSAEKEITTEMQITNEVEPRHKNEITSELQNTNELETNVKNQTLTEMQIANEIERFGKNEITTELQNTNEMEICVKNEITTEMQIINEIETIAKNEITSEMQITNEINSIDEEFKYLYENDQSEVNGVLDIEPDKLTDFTNNINTKIHNEVLSVLKEPINDKPDEEIVLNKCEVKLAFENTDHPEKVTEETTQFLEQIRTEQPETVQNSNNTPENDVINTDTVDDSQNNLEISSKISDLKSSEVLDIKTYETEGINESINFKISPEISTEQPSDRPVYMDLINDTSSEILKDESLDNNVKNIIKSCLDGSDAGSDWSIVKNESTVYLDLPSIKETHDFLQSEKIFSSKNVGISNICTSTPKGSEASTESTLEAEPETEIISVAKDLGVTLTKLEQRYVPDNLSPFDSPSKSHHTDTYDENSSVVLGPFENCTLDLYKGVKSSDLTDLHKEEILALSSNFSEMNLATPSPLRDSNFLNEVPDIVAEEFHFDDIATISEPKQESLTAHNTDETEDQSSTEKRISPSTPPNSPGNFLASTNHKYLIDIDSSNLPNESNLDEIDVNQIELQMTTKLAMAENENNMNLEYSGPLNEEGLNFNETVLLDDAIPESYLAGNKGSVDNLRDSLAIDEERMKELRNELELKLPLAQVAGIEPAVEGEWSELPPPPELVLTYGALSPIVEETRLQLCAYENDDQWNASTHTDSSASYPEPCNISDEVTDLPTAQHSTYTITKDNNHTYTVQKEVTSSKEITMSADSLNASPLKKLEEIQSPIDDKTYTKNDDDYKDANCERLSQVSPFLLSPTTDTSVPESDNIAGVSTLSKTTVPTDAKSSKPSETQCLSKATSIDSWCSNDTLYNVEENFDDLAMDSDIPVEIGEIDHDKSESDDTLTHNDDKELSHCSTYIIHDSKSEVCETFTPDSITANDNYTYTKVKSEAFGTTPSVITKSDLNSTKNTTKDLAYGTLMSGLPTYSHCTELASGIDDSWKFQQPELVRRSPIGDKDKFTPPKNIVNEILCENEKVSPQLNSEPRLRKMESVEITCLKDTSTDANKCDGSGQSLIEENDNEKSPNIHFRNMAHSVTSTPLTIMVEDTDNVNSIPIMLPDSESENSEYVVNSLPNFQTFFQSAEIRPQDISSNVSKEVSSEILLEGESKSISNKDITDKSPGYSDFENSANTKPQDSVTSTENSGKRTEVIQDEFQQFESSVKSRPQDLSSIIDASSLLLKSERRSSEIAMGSLTSTDFDTSHSEKQISDTESRSHNSTNMSNLLESHTLPDRLLGVFITDLDMEEETEQPHSIIITENPLLATKISPNRTFDSHTKSNRKDFSYDSHTGGYQPAKNIWINETFEPSDRVNGLIEIRSMENEPISDIQYSSISMYSEPSAKESHHESDIERSQESTINVLDKNSPSNESIKCNGGNEMYATVNFLNETFEELLESNVDDNDFGNNDYKDDQTMSCEKSTEIVTDSESIRSNINEELANEEPTMSVQCIQSNGINSDEEKKIVLETNSFLENEKNFCQLNSYFPLLSDIRFTGPATEIMSTSFTQDSPTDPTSPECEQDSKPDPTAEILKEWDSDSDSHSTNSSSGEFIWKDGDGHETALVPSTLFDHQRDSASHSQPSAEGGGAEGEAGSGSGDSGSGSEGDEVEFVPSSWDCRAAPAKSSLRSLEQASLSNPDIKKRVVFKRQKYHCVYEYPREVTDGDVDSPAAYLPDYSTYSDWDPSSVEEAELGYGQLFGGPDPLDLFPLRSGIAFGADYDEDFFISSSARPFESLGVMSTTSQFFPGMHVKPMLERELAEDIGEDFPPPPSPLPHAHPPPPLSAPAPPAPAAPPANTALALTPAPSFDFTTPDSGVEDITPGSTIDDDFKGKKLPEPEPACWRATDSASSSESVSPTSPAAEALGGLRHTRDKLKLDLPPSPHAPSPRHSRVFSFVLDKPRRPGAGEATPDDLAPTPGDTPRDPRDDVGPEPTFSTFGKSAHCKPAANPETEKIILTDELREEPVSEGVKQEGSGARVEPVKGEGTVLDSGDEDSGIESSSKATLERNKHTPDVS